MPQVKGFSPLLLEAFREGSKDAFVLPCETIQQARHIRSLLHKLRKAMRDERHELLPLAESVIVSVSENPPEVILRPIDKDVQ